MKIAYLDCATGISGDMTLAALIDAGVDEGAIRAGIDSLGLPGVVLHVETVVKGGFRATHVRVEHPEQHAHRHFSDIVKIIEAASGLTGPQQNLALRIFEAVAQAEARVHGSTIEKVHFHEVGAIDSIVDIVGAAIGFDRLGVAQIVASPIPTGRGRITIDHGICSIPAPGTAELLKGIPLVDVPVEAELTTPTGAAIVKTLVDRFGALPAMSIDAVGYGAGTMDIPGRANVLRIFVGEAAVQPERDQVCVLETSLDDVSGEIIGYVKRRLLEAGALDVYSTAVQMKKDRPGVVVTVLCPPSQTDELESILFEETATFGIRRTTVDRSKRRRERIDVETPWGPVAGKLGWREGEPAVFTPEFEDCARLASETGVPLRELYCAAILAFEAALGDDDEESPDQVHEHDHDHDRGHIHDHDHDHSHDHDHDHSHDHDCGHDHDHG